MCQGFCVWIAGEDLGGPFGGCLGEADGFAGEGFGAAGIGVAKEDAVEGLRGGEAIYCELAGDGHEHGMAAAIEADLKGIGVEFGEQLLEIGKHACGESLAIVFVQQRETLIFAERRVKGKGSSRRR